MLVGVSIQALFFTSCKKENEPGQGNDDPPREESIEGTVWIEGVNVDYSQLSVSSFEGEAGVGEGGDFTLDIDGKQTTQFVTNENGDIVLMGYYFEDGYQNIGLRSTSIALIMNTPAAMLMMPEDKASFAYGLGGLQELNDEVKRLYVEGIPLLDTNNSELIRLIGEAYEANAKKVTSVKDGTIPIQSDYQNRSVVFTNSLKTHSTAISVYKDDEHQKDILVGAVDFFDPLGDIKTESYQMVGDGEFVFKYRTGLPGYDDGIPGHNIAFWDNSTSFTRLVCQAIFPHVNGACYTAMADALINIVKGSYNINTSAPVYVVLLDITGILYESFSNLTTECLTEKNKLYAGKFPFLWKIMAKVKGDAQALLFGAQWLYSDPISEESICAMGDDVGFCKEFIGEWNVTQDSEHGTMPTSGVIYWEECPSFILESFSNLTCKVTFTNTTFVMDYDADQYYGVTHWSWDPEDPCGTVTIGGETEIAPTYSFSCVKDGNNLQISSGGDQIDGLLSYSAYDEMTLKMTSEGSPGWIYELNLKYIGPINKEPDLTNLTPIESLFNKISNYN